LNTVQLDDERPGIHPEPPGDIVNRSLPITIVRRIWYRIHGAHRDALFFGLSTDSRFSAPAGEYGVLYVASDEHGAFIETVDYQLYFNAIRPSVLAHRCLSRIEADRPLRLVDLTADGLARLGADSRLTTGNYAVAQRWSLAFQVHPDEPDGILYRARHDPSRLSAALFDRVSSVVHAERVGILTDPRLAPLLARLLDDYDFQLLDV
jgi:hypothetical protein